MEFCLCGLNLFADLLPLLGLGLRVVEHLSRRIIHANMTTARSDSFRPCVPSYHPRPRRYFVLTDLDSSVTGLGLEVIKTPVRSPKANSLCERLIGTLRRECLDWIIQLTEGHLRKTLMPWLPHYNRGRPHSSLGPGIPGPLRLSQCICSVIGIGSTNQPKSWLVPS